MSAAGLLFDMAAVQRNERSQLGYKRAAKAVVALTESVVDLVTAGTLGDVPFVGPASTRIVTELVQQGRSPSVEQAVETSANPEAVAAKRPLRRAFLSHHVLQAALGGRAPAGTVDRAAYRGDFQMHSTWSDGAERIGTMVSACMELGHSCLGITDHSYGLPVARGMSMANVVRQHQEIDRLNTKHAGAFRVFKGIEANILADGRLDLQPSEREPFEFVVASPHSQLRRAEDQTARMLAAVRAQRVAILGHPRGRIYNTRAGVQADWGRIFADAAAREVAIEIDGNWHRQDVDFELAGRALAAGCLFALNSDAHSIGELRFSEYAIAHARIAGIPKERVINCWSNERLEAWMKSRG